MIAALYVERDGVYFGLPGVDPWDETRDARQYPGPYPVVCHPPCQRWGRMATGGPSAPNTQRLGDDDGKFLAAWRALRRFGGVLEHPKDSAAWDWFSIAKPPKAGWVETPLRNAKAGYRGWVCCVEQGHYGHVARKQTWLVAVTASRPEDLIWGSSGQRLPAYAVERYGYEKARRIGVMAAIGGKDKTLIRERTPLPFRDALLNIARNSEIRK